MQLFRLMITCTGSILWAALTISLPGGLLFAPLNQAVIPP